ELLPRKGYGRGERGAGPDGRGKGETRTSQRGSSGDAMRSGRRRWRQWAIAAAATPTLMDRLSLRPRSAAQAHTESQFWPEFDLTHTVAPGVRLILMTTFTEDRATRDFSEGELGLEVAYRYTPRMDFRLGFHYLNSAPSGLGERQIERRWMADVHP